MGFSKSNDMLEVVEKLGDMDLKYQIYNWKSLGMAALYKYFQ